MRVAQNRHETNDSEKSELFKTDTERAKEAETRHGSCNSQKCELFKTDTKRMTPKTWSQTNHTQIGQKKRESARTYTDHATQKTWSCTKPTRNMRLQKLGVVQNRHETNDSQKCESDKPTQSGQKKRAKEAGTALFFISSLMLIILKIIPDS